MQTINQDSKRNIVKKNLNEKNWMLKEEADGVLVVVHKETGTRKTVRKEGIPCVN